MNWGNDLETSLQLLPRAEAAPPPSVFESDWWRQLGDNARTANAEAWATGMTNSRERSLRDAYGPLLFELNQGRPFEKRLINPFGIPQELQSEGVEMQAAAANAANLGLGGQEQAENDIWAALDEARTQDPGRYANLPKSRTDLYDQVYARARESMEAADATRRSSAPAAAFLGQFIGSAPAMLSDPQNLATAMLGGGGAQTYLRFFLQESAAGGVSTALTLPQIANWRQEIGVPMTGSEAVGTVAGGALGAGILATAGRAAFRNVFEPSWRAARTALDQIARDADVPPKARAAAAVAGEQAQQTEENPFGATDEDLQAHAKALWTATQAVDNGAPAAMPQLESAVVRAAEPAVQREMTVGTGLSAFKPSELETDAAMMQYKRGGDEAGVTERLQGVKEWNSAFAGQVLVFETADGRRIVADGHQRLGLAKRLEAEGQDVTLYGVVLREADGWTAQKARLTAAAKNIAEGSGDSLDAAAILREAPATVTQLPPRSGLVRQARALAQLSSDAWGMVWNGVAGERDAALVGRLVQDPQLHAAILDFVTKAHAETLEEAELMVRQALAAGARTETQTDMFGAMLKADLILPERVRILKASLTQLRRDRGLFKLLTEREGAIKAEGNVLASDANARAMARSAQIFETIKALAERKGPISDALQAAAIRAKETGERRNAIREFVADVRGRVERGDLDGEAARGTVGHVDAETAGFDRAAEAQQPEPGRALETASLFSDPAGKPEAFAQQRKGLAAELGGEAMHGPAPVEISASEALLTEGQKDTLKSNPNARVFSLLQDGKPAGRITGNIEGDTFWVSAIVGAGENALGPANMRAVLRQLADELPASVKYVTGERISGARAATAAKGETVRVPLNRPEDLGEDAAKELGLFDRFDAKDVAPALEGDGVQSIGELRAELENDAKAVERMRRCVEGGE